MEKYWVNHDEQDESGDHEVHIKDCKKFPSNILYLGEFSNCADAVTQAKKTYKQSNGCYHCCNACHTS